MNFPGEEDPFISVQKEVQKSWDLISNEYQQWASVGARGGTTATTARDDLQNKLHTLEWDIQDLQEAVRIAKEDPARFRLSTTELSSREHFVSEMTQKVQRLQTALTGSSADPNLRGKGSDRNELLSGGTETAKQKETRQANDNFISEEMQQQELIMDQQDEDLGHLASAVERIGLMGHEMHQGLEEQGQLLDGLAEDMDTTRSRMANVREKLDRFIAETGPRQFCTIVGLSITFLILTVLVATT